MINNKKIYVLLPLFLVLIIDAMGVGLVLPLLGPLFISRTSGIVSITMSMGERNLLYGITLAIFCVFMFFGAPFFGDLSDHLGRKKVLLICLYGTVVGLLVSAWGVHINNLFLLIAGRGLAGFMCGSQALAQAAIVDISTEETKAINLSFISLASCIGFVLGPSMGGLLSDQHLWSGLSYTTPFWIAAILAFINGTLLLFTFKETYYPKAKQKLKLTKGAEIFISAFTNKLIRKLALVFLLAEIGWSLYFQFLSLYLIAVFHYNAAKISHIMAALGIGLGVTFLLLVRIIVKVLKPGQITYMAIALSALGVFLSVSKSEAMIWIAVIPISVGGALFYVALLTLFSDIVDKDSQGWIMGIFAAVGAASWSIGGFLTGVLGMFGLLMPFIVAGILLIGAEILYFI